MRNLQELKQIGLLLLLSLAAPINAQSPMDNVRITQFPPIDSSVSIRGIFAQSAGELWLGGSNGHVYHITDGGQSHERIHIPGGDSLGFRDVQGLDAHTILLMSVGPGAQSKIFKTTDNDATWKIVYTNPHKSGFLNSIAFWDASRGLAVGDPIAGKLNILRTDDGGESWQDMASSRLPDVLEGEYGFAASGTCVAVAGTDDAWIGTGGPQARIFRTNDGGMHWEVFTTPLLCEAPSAGIFSVYFENESEGYVVGGDYTKETATEKTFARTTDGGATWIGGKANFLPFQSVVTTVVVSGKKHILTAGPAGVFIATADLNWLRLSEQGYHCLSRTTDRKTVWLAGSGGRYAKVGF